jgi:hypothetical protein
MSLKKEVCQHCIGHWNEEDEALWELGEVFCTGTTDPSGMFKSQARPGYLVARVGEKPRVGCPYKLEHILMLEGYYMTNSNGLMMMFSYVDWVFWPRKCVFVVNVSVETS